MSSSTIPAVSISSVTLFTRAILLSLFFALTGFSNCLCMPVDSLVIENPISFNNLSVFPIESFNATFHPYLPLEEALRLHRAVIHENNSQTLWIENLSDSDLYIQSGDIIKGGQQDRIIESDLILPAHNTSHNLNVFCVEQDRSFQRGNEPIATFSSSTEMAPLPHMRVIANYKLTSSLLSPALGGYTAPDSQQLRLLQSLSTIPQLGSVDEIVQQSIWNDVDAVQASLISTLHDSLTHNASPSSLQLTLEHHSLLQKREAFERKLLDAIRDRPHVVGVIYSIGDTILGGNIYGSHELFSLMWPKLLRAMSTESIMAKSSLTSSVAIVDIQNFLLSTIHGKSTTDNLNERTAITANETGGIYRFTTRDKKYGATVHTAYLRR